MPAILARTKCASFIRKRLREHGVGAIRVGLRPDGFCTAPLTKESHDAAFLVQWARFGWAGLKPHPGARLLREHLPGYDRPVAMETV